MLVRPNLNWHNPAVRKVLRLMGPAILQFRFRKLVWLLIQYTHHFYLVVVFHGCIMLID